MQCEEHAILSHANSWIERMKNHSVLHGQMGYVIFEIKINKINNVVRLKNMRII